MKILAPLLIISTLALVGCSSQSAPSPAPTVEPPVLSPAPTDDDLSLGPVPADALLVITATATAPDGAVLQLEQRVRTPVPFDDIGGYVVPEATIASCPDLLSVSIAAQQLWTFTRVNYLAISVGDIPWPTDQPIAIRPSTTSAPIASMSFLGEVSGAGQPCQLEKFVPGQGKGAISIGAANDATDPAAGGYQRWSQLDFGFVTTGTDVVLSDCTFTLTSAGSALGGGIGWTSAADAQNCVTGAPTPASLY